MAGRVRSNTEIPFLKGRRTLTTWHAMQVWNIFLRREERIVGSTKWVPSSTGQPGPAEVGSADLFVRGLRPFGVAFDDRDVTVDGQICKSLSFTTG
jgi:hypothetical protein